VELATEALESGDEPFGDEVHDLHRRFHLGT
jgi:hypothetical protein